MQRRWRDAAYRQMAAPSSTTAAIARLLVFLQFLTIGLLVSTFFWLPIGVELWPRIVGGIVALLGIGIIVSASNTFQRVNNTMANVTPLPKEGTALVTEGVWGYVRHPMYCSLWMMSLGLCCFQQHWGSFVVWGGFVVLLVCKGRFEEVLLAGQFEEYAQYRRHSCMLIIIPGYHYTRSSSNPPPR